MAQPTKTEAIKNFLILKAPPDLADLYNHDMECQVNVDPDGGERISGEYKGSPWVGWSDGLTTWKAFRIPYKAATNPEYTDTEMKFDLKHAQAIGMTGWDWKSQESLWVAFDFDAIIGHAEGHQKKLTYESLQTVEEEACAIPWVTVRRSTSGTGLHLYVFLDHIKTTTHTEHAALARSILGMMSALTGFDFVSKVDACGGNMWVWGRRKTETGLTLVKHGVILREIPPNWRDHIKVVKGSRRKNLPQNIEDAGSGDAFEELCSQRHAIPLDETHRQLINYLKETKALWWWDSDHHMIVTHTIHLKQAHKDLNFRGIFNTLSKGREIGTDYNCFCHPLRDGSWSIRRFTRGVQEDESWEQDGQGWTRCFYNKEPDLATACRTFGGMEDEKGGFMFREAENAIKAAQALGVTIDINAMFHSREATLKQHRDGRLIVTIDRNPNDHADKLPGFLAPKGTKPWLRIYRTQVSAPAEPELSNYDDLIRHLITEVDEDYGWMLKGDGAWRLEPLQHIKPVLASYGYTGKEINEILGSSIIKCWKVVNKPFQPEYTGDREWNRNAAQFRYPPSQPGSELYYPNWSKILDHCGAGLDDAISENGWAKANGILTGAEYLKIWIASLFQQPLEPLPYLFFYSVLENTGKSTFHEAISLLLTKGYKRADAALISQAGFNAELDGAIVCVVEETDLRINKAAYSRIKDWVTGREINIHVKGRTPYMTPNSTHWIQCSNDHKSCPIFTGDTRITMIHVPPIDPIDLIPKRKMIPMLEKESPDFLRSLLDLEIPESNDRLNVPVVVTSEKLIAEELNQSELQAFIRERCYHTPGYVVTFGDFYDKFQEYCDPNEVRAWARKRVGMEMPPQYPRGRVSGTAAVHIGNISFMHQEEKREPLLLKGERLI